MNYEKILKDALNSKATPFEVSSWIEEQFPELAKSDDEEIRKALINVFATHKDYEMFFGVSVEDIRAWLEKQVEQKASYTTMVETGDGGINALVTLPIEMKTAEESLGISSDEYNKIVDECLFGEQKLTEFERGLFDMLTDISKPCTADCVKSHSEKLLSIARKMIALEQKPEENKGNVGGISPNSAWSEENEPQKELAETYLTVFDKKFPILPTLKGKRLADYKNFLNKCQQIFGLKYWGIRPRQAKLFEKLSLLWAAWGAEHLQGLGQTDGDMDDEILWSEEDEMFVHGLIRGLAAKRDIHGHTTFSSDCIDITKTIDWLQSLKGRVQPKQEWSEEDERMFASVIGDILCEGAFIGGKEPASNKIDWLQSLKERIGGKI